METKEVELVNIKKLDESGNSVEELKTVAAPTASAAVVEASSAPIARSDILKPGTKIRPQVTEEDAIKLAERLYGITTSEICPLISYDDRNFLIHVDR